MNNFPDFISHGYQAVKELGCNTAGFRTTYKASSLSSSHEVIIKHFEAIPKNLDEWNALDRMYVEEIQALSGLKHSHIPHFIESFQMEDRSRCIVLEYKDGQTLAEPRSFSPDQIKLISVSLLEILVYLQDQIPSVKHRDIKPENILVNEADGQLKVYLVDFGFARIGDGEARTVSSMIKGTLGFMAPEQRRNQPLTNASDLYGLGATLICLLTGIKSIDIDNLTDNHNNIRFKELVPNFSIPFISWVEKLVEPDPKKRHLDAETALKALMPLHVRRVPEIIFNSAIHFKATKLGEKITQVIEIRNSISDTTLEGELEVRSHSNDLKLGANNHWINVSPDHFCSNLNRIKITIDTSNLMAEKTYTRKIVIYSNTLQESSNLTVSVQTAPLPIESIEIPPYGELSKLCILSSIAGTIIFWISYPIISCIVAFHTFASPEHPSPLVLIITGAIAGPLCWLMSGLLLGMMTIAFIFKFLHFIFSSGSFAFSEVTAQFHQPMVGLCLYLLFGSSMTWGATFWIFVFYQSHSIYSYIEDRINKYRLILINYKMSHAKINMIIFSTCLLGIGIAIRFFTIAPVEVMNIFVFFALASFIFILIATLSPILYRRIAISKYRASEDNLIQP